MKCPQWQPFEKRRIRSKHEVFTGVIRLIFIANNSIQNIVMFVLHCVHKYMHIPMVVLWISFHKKEEIMRFTSFV